MFELEITVLAASTIIALAALWRQRHSARQRELMWREMVGALAAGDHARSLESARVLETVTMQEMNASPTQMVRTLETRNNEQQIARRDLEDVLSSLQDAVLVVDDEARLRFLNASALHFFGVHVEDVLGAQLLEALPSFGLEAAVRAALRDNQNNAREMQLYASPQHFAPRAGNGMPAHEMGAGARREVLLRVSPVRRSDGGVSGAVAILQDLTEVRRLERVRRDFVANASHELRTPIANIRATAETILDSPENPTLTARFLPQLVGEAERLSRLVSDLLDLARADSSSQNQDAPVDVCHVMREAARRLQDKAAAQEVTLECACDGILQAPGDAAALEQVAFNLLDNALMYTPPQGRVTIAVEAAPNDKSPSDEPAGEAAFVAPASIILTVSDTGIGIPADDLPRIFERFYRVDKARSRAQGGTGLGLAIVKHIVENHGGHVKVESQVGQGTTFTVTLPAR